MLKRFQKLFKKEEGSEPNWQFFIRNEAEMISVDTALAARMPVQLTHVHIISEPLDEDTPSLDDIHQFEDALITILPADCVYVGRRLGSELLEFYIYGAADAPMTIIQQVVHDFFESPSLITELDPEWRRYRYLLPTDEDFQAISNLSVVEAARRGGDTLMIPRQVDHYLFFPTEEMRNNFSRDITEEGFSFESGDDGIPDYPFGLHVWRTDHVEFTHINSVVLGVYRKAKEYDAVYDGWASDIVGEEE